MREWMILLVVGCMLMTASCTEEKTPKAVNEAEDLAAVTTNPKVALSPVEVLEAVKRHDAAFRARIVEVGDSPGFGSGYLVARQSVKYTVLEVYYGTLVSKGDEVDVQHVIVGGGPAEDSKQPKLNPALMRPGREVILLVYGKFPGCGKGLYVSGDDPAGVIFLNGTAKGN